MFNNVLIKTICFILVSVTLMSCNRKTTKQYFRETGELLSEIEYNKKGQIDGELREYFPSGELKTIEYYKNGKIIDTTYGFDKSGNVSVKRYNVGNKSVFERYYDNGTLLSKGIMRDTFAEGWWDYYDKDGNIFRKVEFLNLNEGSSIINRQYPNQIIFYDKKGNIIRDSSNYFKIDLKDTLKINKLSIGHIELIPQTSKKSDFFMVYFWSQSENGKEVALDSTYGKNRVKAEFWLLPKITGKHWLKGYILEKGYINEVNEENPSFTDVIERTKKLYFEKEYFVKDTI
ncbi:toxin-antitoxin system YwqK family antitoxin [Flagellimonas beolgyonensis]|uniref:toxin-antitoxin system YwqK family antitoxin n=1 Tax=Flagellimonas beolgyonensis TaxID=864064 RepID=UPI003D645A47